MKKYNFKETAIKRISDEEKVKISFWFTTEQRDTACITYTRYMGVMTVEHSMLFNIDDSKRYYVNKLESGLNKEIKSVEDNPDCENTIIKYFKNNPTVSRIFEQVSKELDKEVPKRKLLIVDVTKQSPMFDSKELLKLHIDNKHYVTIFAKDIYSSIINITYRLDGLFTKNMEVALNPINTLKERIIEEVKDFERENDISVMSRFLNSSASDRFIKNIDILVFLKKGRKDNTVSSIEVNPMVPCSQIQHKYMVAPYDINEFYLDIKITRRKQGSDVTTGYVLMREHKVDELIHHYPILRYYTYKLYTYNPRKIVIKDNDNGAKLRSLTGKNAELVLPTRDIDYTLETFSFRKVCLELCTRLGKFVSSLMNCELNIGHLLEAVYDNRISKLYDSDILKQLNEEQESQVYAPFIDEIIDTFDNSYEDKIKYYGRFSKIEQIKASVAYNFRNLLAELNNRYLVSNTIVSDASCYMIADCELLKRSAEVNVIDIILFNDMGKQLTEVLSLKDKLSFSMHCTAKDGKIIIRSFDVLLTKNGPVISSMMVGGEIYRDTKMFTSIQDNLEELLGEYLYGLLKFLGKLLYIYDLLNDDVRDIQYISITKDGETIDNVLDLVYNPVKDTYKEYIKRLRYNAESEDQQDEFSIDYDEYE